MEIQKEIEELLKINQEMENQRKIRTIRRILQVFLVGFLVWKNVDRMISENANRKKQITNSLRTYFKGFFFLSRQLDELKKVDAFTARVAENKCYCELLSLEKDFRFLVTEEAREAISILEEKDIELYKQTIGDCLGKYLERKKKNAENLINNVVSRNTYLIYSEKELANQNLRLLGEELDYFRSRGILTEFCSVSQIEISQFQNIISNYNREFIEKRKKEYFHLFKRETLSLDEEQKDAVVTDDKYNLVVAGAGSGKTEALITRIAYLIERKPDTVRADRILAIAYQNKDVKQILERLHDRYGIDNVEVKTFHKLGKEILEKAGIKLERSSIINENKKREVIKALHHQRLNQPEYFKLFLKYVKTLRDDERNNKFESKSEILNYAKRRPYFSINNVRVNSRAEKEIMDFLLTNKINNESITVDYEPDLDGFRPDFMLPKYNLYIEHWALNEKGEAPSWFDQTSDEYKEKMHLKKEWFNKNHKLLVETFTYEYDESNPEPFIELLKKRVTEKLANTHSNKIEFTPLSYEELVEVAWGPYKDPADDIVNFVTIAKTYGLSSKRIEEKLNKSMWSKKQFAFGKLALKIFEEYENTLVENQKIDFEDMINEAISELESNKDVCSNIYDHMLIDEYQDVSDQRYKLIKNLLEHNPKCKLFCVGDDWQSIMAFAGSNLDFFVNFQKYFENPAVDKKQREPPDPQNNEIKPK